jgi:hypothetical protein
MSPSIPVTYPSGETQTFEVDVTTGPAAPSTKKIVTAVFGTGKNKVTMKITPGAVAEPTPPSPTLAITTTEFPPAVEGVAYTAQLEASGGTPPFLWVNQGGLADGLHIDATTGAVSGAVDIGANTYTAQIQVTDSKGVIAHAAIAMVVTAAPTPPPSPPPTPPGGYQPSLPADLASLVDPNSILFDYDFATQGEPTWGDVFVNSWFGGQEFNGKANFSLANLSFTDEGMVFASTDNGDIGVMVNTDLRQNSKGYQYQYAYVEALLNCPADANWFTFWTAAQGDPNGGENDIIEFDGPNAWTSNYHWAGGGSNDTPGPQYPGQWIKYGLIATPDTYYVIWNGEVVRQYTNEDAGAEHYLLFSSGTAGAFQASDSPTTIGRVTVWALA